MTPPEAPVTGLSPRTETPPAVSVCPPLRIETLRKRADFLHAAGALRQSTSSFLLQARKRAASEPAAGIRIGYTCSKKIGNAVARNRAKRRLREIARQIIPSYGKDGWDYVLVGRPGATIDRPYSALVKDLHFALSRIHDG